MRFGDSAFTGVLPFRSAIVRRGIAAVEGGGNGSSVVSDYIHTERADRPAWKPPSVSNGMRDPSTAASLGRRVQAVGRTGEGPDLVQK